MQEKREKATAQKLRKARERGEVVKSGELVFALLFCGVTLLLWGVHSLFYSGFKKIFSVVFLAQSPERALFQAFQPIALPLGMTLLGLMFLVFGAHFFQSGWVWHRKKRGKGAKRWLFPLIQWGCVALLGYAFLHNFNPTSELIFATAGQKFNVFFQKILFLSLAISGILILLGFADFAYQKWLYLKKMRMSPQEIKEERKESEINPQIKAHRRKRS